MIVDGHESNRLRVFVKPVHIGKKRHLVEKRGHFRLLAAPGKQLRSRYQFLLGENIGVGDVRHFGDQERWREAAGKGMADSIVENMPAGYDTQLGKWFKDGQELSGGQWQKIALSRAFMREEADILVLDEPTAAMDAAAEARIFEHFRRLTQNRIAILISHRFSTVRMASQIIVIENGKIIERGSHQDLMQLNGHYAHLFSLQAAGYK